MKKNILVLSALVVLTSSFSFLEAPKIQDESILNQVAVANGFNNWKNVNELKFTFNVDRNGTHFERSWVWNPKSKDITSIAEDGTTISYNWKKIDSTTSQIDAKFINDKYWLLAPYQLVWDRDNIEHTHATGVKAPLSEKVMQKLTIIYGAEGGYTPGDAYDFYFEDDLIIKEWAFRKGNAKEPSMITTFEDYKEMKGLKLATMHKMDDGQFQLYFTGIEVN